MKEDAPYLLKIVNQEAQPRLMTFEQLSQQCAEELCYLEIDGKQ